MQVYSTIPAIVRILYPETCNWSLLCTLCINKRSQFCPYIHPPIPVPVANTIQFHTVLCFFDALAAN